MFIPQEFHEYINYNDLQYFADACDIVLEKKEKQAIAALFMIELWMNYQTLKKYFDTVLKPAIAELTEDEKERFREMISLFPENDRFKKCYICEFPLETLILSKFNTSTDKMTRLNFIVRNKYQFLKTIFTEEKMANSLHLASLESYYSAMDHIFSVCEDMLRRQTIQFMLQINLLYVIGTTIFWNGICKTVTLQSIFTKNNKEFNVKNKLDTNKQNTFALVYTRNIDFPHDSITKKYASNKYFSDLSNRFSDGFSVIHRSHVTREIYG